jgi:predicted nucleic acid-binding protein
MEKYEDIPMDFADATLVSLAEEIDLSEILTLDRRGFSTYRMRGKTAFKIWPA